jgi:hypothetical protein
LLDDRQLDWRVEIETEKEVNIIEKYTDAELQVLSSITLNNFNYEMDTANFKKVLKLVDFSTKNKSATRYGTTVWSNTEIGQLLAVFGLPQDSPLSIVVVEILPQITNIFEHVSRLDKPAIAQATGKFVAQDKVEPFRGIVHAADTIRAQKAILNIPSPVDEELGHHRILRVSPLTQVPEICCSDC